MKTATGAVTAASRPTHGRVRWRKDRIEPAGRSGFRSTRRRIRIACLIGATMIGAGYPVAHRLMEPPKVEPPFERIVDEGAGPIKWFSLRDAQGRCHARAEWADRRAIVLYFIATECPISNGYAPEMARLAGEFGPRGVAFYGIHSDSELTAASAAAHAAEYGLPFPILLDPDHRVTREAGATRTPEAVVVLPEGQILYRGRIDDRYSADRRQRPGAGAHDLEAALVAILADEMPVVTRTIPFGCPIPPGVSSVGGDRAITFTKHVAPILWKNCAKCHRPGEVAPFSLMTYKDAAKRAEFIRDVTASGQMPPWKPHPGAGAFLDDPRLSVAEKEILRVWAESGCAEGDAADLPEPPRFVDGWRLGQPDLVLTMPEAMSIPADGFDVYRAFALPFPLDHEVTITGLEYRPGNRRIVHHSRIHLDETGDARRRDQTEPGPGFSGWFGGPSFELPYPGLGAWTPGVTPRLAPEGVGRVIKPGSDIAIEVHYHPTGKPESDRSSIGLFFAKHPVTRTMTGFSFSTDRIDIPAGAKRHVVIQSAKIKADVHLYSVVPHAHYLCREMRLAATLPDSTNQPLLWITDWDLDTQDQYRFAKPVRLPKGALLTFVAYFDNSEDNPRNPYQPPRRIRYGHGTKDEMCACHMEILPDDPSGYRAYPSKSPFGL